MLFETNEEKDRSLSLLFIAFVLHTTHHPHRLLSSVSENNCCDGWKHLLQENNWITENLTAGLVWLRWENCVRVPEKISHFKASEFSGVSQCKDLSYIIKKSIMEPHVALLASGSGVRVNAPDLMKCYLDENLINVLVSSKVLQLSKKIKMSTCYRKCIH